MTQIIHVLGPQGSGKTYLLNKLKKYEKFLCIDSDDFVTKAYYNVRNTPSHKKDLVAKKTTFRTHKKEQNRLFSEIVKFAGNNNKTLLFVGMTYEIPEKYKITGYLLKANTSQLKIWYRRAMIRDYNKVCKDRTRILRTIKQPDIMSIAFDNIFGLNMFGMDVTSKFNSYQRKYTEMIKSHKHYTLISQTNLIDKLKKFTVK